MQYVSRTEFLELLDLTSGAFNQLQHTGHVALAFGSPVPAFPGRYLDLDLVAMAINLGLSQTVNRSASTAIVSGFFHQWGSAVGHAEANPSDDTFMAVAGIGWDPIKKTAKRLLVTNGTMEEVTGDFKPEKDLVGYFTVNVSDIIRRLRARAGKAGINLSQPFFWPPDDPRFKQILTQYQRELRTRVERLRKDKKKATLMKSQRLRQDIVAAPRVRDIKYPDLMAA